MTGSEGSRRIRVLLADDHTMFRQGIAAVLEGSGDLEVVAQTANDDTAVEAARRTRPDVVLMQVQTPMSRAKMNLRRMREVDPALRIVVVTMLENPRYVREFMELGVSAYVVKSASAEHLVGAVRSAIADHTGKSFVVGMPRELLETNGSSDGLLSDRELEVLLLAARGLSNRQISQSLHVAEGTVKRHLANTYEKMDVRSRGEAARKALFEEWITIADVTGESDGIA